MDRLLPRFTLTAKMRPAPPSRAMEGRLKMWQSLITISVVSLCSAWLSVEGKRAFATPPSLTLYFVNPPGLAAAVEKHFGEPAASRALTDIKKSVHPRPPLVNPYSASFVAVKEEFTMLSVFVDLWKETKGSEEPRRFEEFLTAVNKAPVVRGMVDTPDYSGCVLVLFSLAQEGGRRFLVVQLSAHQFRGCRRTYGSRFRTSSRVSLD